MKKIIAVIAALAVVFLATPPVIGGFAEAHLRAMYSQMNEHPSVSVDVTEYQSGWFTSNAKITVTIQSNSPKAIPPVVVTQKLFHGPLLWETSGLSFGMSDSVFGIELPADIQSEIDKTGVIKPDTLNVAMRVYFNGSFDSKLALKPFSYAEKSVEVSVSEANILTSASSDGRVSSEGFWDGMTVRESGATVFNMGKMTITADQVLKQGEFFSPYAIGDGDFELGIASLDIKPDSPAESVKVEALKVTGNSKVVGDVVNAGAVFSAKSINAVQQSFTDFIYDISLENLHVETMQAINEKMSDPAAQANPMMAMASVQGLLPQLVEKNPILKINNIGITTPQGKIETKMEVKFDQSVYDASNPMTMMAALDASANGEAPEQFFTNMGMGAQVEQMIQMNYLVRNSDKLEFDFTFKQGQALLNGNPIPLM